MKRSIRESFDYVVNLGGYVDHSNKKKTLKSHYDGCKNLAEIFFKKVPLSFIQIGSSLEYGNSNSPQKENMKCNLKSIKSTYGKAKLLSSIYMINLFKKKKFPSTVLRLYLAYGPRQDVNRFLPIIITGCIKNKKFPCSEGVQLRDFTHVDDVVDANIIAMESGIGGTYNIGSGIGTSVNKIFKSLAHILEYRWNPIHGPERSGDVFKIILDISRARQILGWSPRITLEDGLSRTIDYLRATSK